MRSGEISYDMIYSVVGSAVDSVQVHLHFSFTAALHRQSDDQPRIKLKLHNTHILCALPHCTLAREI